MVQHPEEGLGLRPTDTEQVTADPTQAPAADVEPVPVARQDLLGRFRREYRGPHDPADALYWLDEPDRAGPSGAPPPSAAALALRRRVYGPDAAPGDVARLAALHEQVECDRVEARRARSVAMADSAAAVATAPPSGPAVGGEPKSIRTARTWARIRVASIALGCTALGVGVGALIGVLEPGAGDGPAVGATNGVVTTVDPSIVLHPTGSPAEVGVILSPQIVPSTVAVLLALDTDRPALFAARDRLGDVCLLVSREFVTAACVPPADFQRSGVTLQWTADLTGPGRVASWLPDGDLSVRPVP